MAKKLPLAPVGIALGTGVVAYLAGVRLAKSVQWFQQHWYAVPAAAVGGGLLIARKHAPIGLGLAGAGGAIGYFQYAAAKGQQTIPQATTTPPATTGTTPATSQTQPASYTPPASTTPTPTGGTTDQGGASQTAQDALNALLGGGSGTGASDAGTSVGGTATDTGTNGYGAGALMGRRTAPMTRHAGALLDHRITPMTRHAGAFDYGDAGSLDT